ncbi:hypothetical protein [Methylobacterium segetis]|uniref:hypothetical protein n=1 Tax=Methylobacterium segetis TaxID=2488750 RepID=UPI00104C36E7|nr:hypothetical protein [Methylobacterium segetis]
MSQTANDRQRRKAARTRATGTPRSGRMGLLAALLAVLIVVLAGLPDDRYAGLMPRTEAVAALSTAPAAPGAKRHVGTPDRHVLTILSSADADDPPSDDRRLVPDAVVVERLSPAASYPPRTSPALPPAAASLLDRPPKFA